MLTQYPVQWRHPATVELLTILQGIYRHQEIERIAEDAGLPLHEISWENSPALVWRSILNAAAAALKVPDLIDAIGQQKPALGYRLSELQQGHLTRDLSLSDTHSIAFDSPKWKNFSTNGDDEAIIVEGRPTFVDALFLQVGSDRARSVCRVMTQHRHQSSGSGFKISEDTILTNYHVLFDRRNDDRRANSVEAWFNYETNQDGGLKRIQTIECDPNTIIGESDLDWAIVRTTSLIPDEFPSLNINETVTIDVNDQVYIIQHPYGQPKKISLGHNLVRHITKDIIQYWTDTDEGSSGAPVFDQHWKLVAVHHQSVPAPRDDRINIRNQGIRINSIAKRLKRLQPGTEWENDKR